MADVVTFRCAGDCGTSADVARPPAPPAPPKPAKGRPAPPPAPADPLAGTVRAPAGWSWVSYWHQSSSGVLAHVLYPTCSAKCEAKVRAGANAESDGLADFLEGLGP